MSLKQFLYSIWIVLLMQTKVFGAADCPEFTRLGCFKDSMNPRPLPTILMTDRDPGMRVYSGVKIDWKGWNDYMTDLACRCAKKTKESGFKVFGLQFFGECWSGVNAENSYKQDGPSQECLTNDFLKCGPKDKYCVGKQDTNFVYALNASSPTSQPTDQPKTKPTTIPKTKPTTRPETVLTSSPTSQPTGQPRKKPTIIPKIKPTTRPESVQSLFPSPKSEHHDDLACKVYNLTVLLSNNSFDDHLRFAHSPQFIELRREFELGVLQAYDGYNPFLGVTTLRFSKAPGDSHTVVHFVIEFKDKGVHLHNLTAALARENLGKLTLLPSLGQVACYKGPFPPVGPLPCFSACAPRCYFSCCQQYHLNYYAILLPPHNIHRAPCPEGCPITCAPFGCTTHCCHSLPHYEYWKRHQAPKLGSNRKLATSSIDIIRRIKRKKKKPGAKRIKETNSSEKNF